LGHAEEMFALAPIHELHLTATAAVPSSEWLEGAFRGAWLRRVTTLDLRHAGLDGERLRVLLGSPGLTGVERLDLHHNGGLGNGASEALAVWPGLGRLRWLNLMEVPCDVDAVCDLVLAWSALPEARERRPRLGLGCVRRGHGRTRLEGLLG